MRDNVQLHTATTRTSSAACRGTPRLAFEASRFEALAGTPLDLQGEGRKAQKKRGPSPAF